MKKRYILILSIYICFLSCKKDQNKNLENSPKKSTYKTSQTNTAEEAVATLLAKAIKKDTLEFENWEPFIYFKSGYLLSKKEKNAIIVSCPTDSIYTIELYTKRNGKWIKNDQQNNIEAHPIQFDIYYKDYNFDGQTDIYLQETVSNGWPLSLGHLFIINPKTKKLEEHKETRDLANMNPVLKDRIIYTDELDYSYKFRKVKRRINKWENGKLVPFEIDKSKETNF
ncbi:hypothetical protein [Flavobacterium sp. LC2016-01]|uniref:XAC2610-related protein n=1 Tax=Flavobacterium sp. LC2016-01 TaxID=2675876 RepID=UPI0012BB1421|nr:hypothetical protein [Flavobacterium sp. LC2016-01]MTH18123.1 hypothetical protein [Flavobacterium sp. LC2016-01]